MLFHGTNAELEPGDILEPSTVTGIAASGTRLHPHVFVTRFMRHAGDWAVNAAFTADETLSEARVYEVEPIGAMTNDPLELGSGYRVERAVVVRELERKRWSRGAAAYV